MKGNFYDTDDSEDSDYVNDPLQTNRSCSSGMTHDVDTADDKSDSRHLDPLPGGRWKERKG